MNERHKLAAHSKDILEFAEGAVHMLNESEDSIINRLSDLRRTLAAIEKLRVPEAADFISQCETLIESTREFAIDIENLAGKIDVDGREFMQMEERLQVLQTLKHRYGPTLEDVIKTHEEASAKLADMGNYTYIRKELEEKIEKAKRQLDEKCENLSLKRKKASAKFTNSIINELKKLGFPNAVFKISFTATEPGPGGTDSIAFLFSANPDGDPVPLRQAASSGEISRLMLALKTVIAESDSIPILIFDEIDVNIGGTTAVVVGNELKTLGKTHQLICISHLPQVAAAAEHHFRVDKSLLKGKTSTQIKMLNSNQRKEEITRMLGGGKSAQLHAEELLS